MGGTFTFHHHAISWVVSHDCTHVFVSYHLLQMSLDVNDSCRSEVLVASVRKVGSCR